MLIKKKIGWGGESKEISILLSPPPAPELYILQLIWLLLNQLNFSCFFFFSFFFPPSPQFLLSSVEQNVKKTYVLMMMLPWFSPYRRRGGRANNKKLIKKNSKREWGKGVYYDMVIDEERGTFWHHNAKQCFNTAKLSQQEENISKNL